MVEDFLWTYKLIKFEFTLISNYYIFSYTFINLNYRGLRKNSTFSAMKFFSNKKVCKPMLRTGFFQELFPENYNEMQKLKEFKLLCCVLSSFRNFSGKTKSCILSISSAIMTRDLKQYKL